MPSVNHVVIMGHLGRDPELKYTQSGTAVWNFAVATSRKQGDGFKTDWHNGVVWSDQAERLAEQCSKGDLVYVEGSLRYDEWEKDGVKHTKAVISAFRMLRLRGSEKKGEQRREQKQEYKPPPPETDVPF